MIIQETDEICLQETDEASLNETEQISLQETDVMTIQKTDEVLAQETDEEIVQETDEEIVQETDAVGVQKTDEVSLQETAEVSLQETEQVSVIDYRDSHQAYFTLRVTDMDKAIEFYKDIFGFKVLFNITDWVELSLPCDCVRLGLSLVEEGTVTQGSGQILFYVDNVNRVKEYLTSKGAEFRDVDIGYTGEMEVGRSRYG